MRWERDGFAEYARRLRAGCTLELVEIAAQRRTRGGDIARAIEREGARQLAAIAPRARVVALDEHGRQWTTREFAARLQRWIDDARDVDLLVGGADGLAPACRQRAEEQWSLSALTLPHGLVRVVVAEQIYRAASLLGHHPYHRD